MYRICLIVFAGVLLPILLYLGFWQLGRYEEKLVIEENLQLRRFTPLSLDDLRELNDQRFYPLTITGTFDNSRYFLLDNRTFNGRVGFHVLTPFLTNNGELVLVDRGWIVGSFDRRHLPDIPQVYGLTTIVGQSWQPVGEAFLLKEDVWRTGWPKVIQAIDKQAMTNALQTDDADSIDSIEPWLLILDSDQPGSLQRNFHPTSMPAERHLGYAVQWFVMALALVLLTIWAFYKEVANKKINNKK